MQTAFLNGRIAGKYGYIFPEADMAEKKEIRARIQLLRAAMKEAGTDFYLITSCDYHASEYIGDYFKVAAYYSGCTSDNVRLLFTQDEARLWTDGRYFISAALELEDTGISLMKSGEHGVPSLPQYLEASMTGGSVIGFNGRTVSANEGWAIRRVTAMKNAKADGTLSLAEKIWTDRPAMPCHPIRILTDDLTGENTDSKITRVRAGLKEAGADYLILSKLDDIMWLLNLRGQDIASNPVALCFMILSRTTADLFLQKGEVDDNLYAYMRTHRIKLHGYEEFYDYLRDYHFEGRVYLDRKGVSDSLFDLLTDKAKLVFGMNPTTRMKAVKNDTELRHIRQTFLLDSVVMTKFLYKIKTMIGKVPLTEMDAALLIDDMRKEIPGYLDLSFETISAYNANAAMAHYAPDKENSALLAPSGFLLVDSGAQYLGGTTDVTRTIVLGELSHGMKEDFTAVLKANLRLLFAVFPFGATGMNLDTYARAPLWDRKTDYNHGTGHGIGYILNVHEGPQNIRWKAGHGGDQIFLPGMITSDEPGIYREGKWGIRTETITECVDEGTGEFGRFLSFRPLTFVPVDLEAVLTEEMDRSDIDRLNRYHKMVREKIAPYLEGEELEFLNRSTREVKSPEVRI